MTHALTFAVRRFPSLLFLPLIAAQPLRAQLLNNLQSFPDRIAVGDPQTVSSDFKEGPKGVATADFDGDGKPDLAAGNLDGTVTLLTGLGGGKFSPPRHLRTGAHELRSVLAADWNGDGKPDLAVASPMDGKLLLYFNDGGGNFSAPTPLQGWVGVRALAAGDFDGDGKLDLAAGGPGLGVRHFRGTGGGAFQIMGDLPRLSPLNADLPRPVYALRTIPSRDGLRDELLVTHADTPALYILSTVPADRSQEPPMDLNRLPAWGTLPAPVLMNEVQVHNATTLRDADGTAQPWVELINKSSAAVNMTGWKLTLEGVESWTLPSVTIAPGRMQIVFLSGKNRSGGPELHASFLLKQNSKRLSLLLPGGGAAHELPLAEYSIADVSFGLAPDLNALKYFDIPSPGAGNNAGLSNLDDLRQDSVTTLTITPRNPAPDEPVRVRLTMPGEFTGSSRVQDVWFSAMPALYENHHLLRRVTANAFEAVLPPGSFKSDTPHRVLARLRDGTGNDYTGVIHRGLDEAESNLVSPPQPGRLLPVASVPSPKVKSFEAGNIRTAVGASRNAPDLIFADDVCGMLRVHRAGPGARRFDPLRVQDVPVRGAPRDVKLADIDGDGWLDATVVLRGLDLALTFKNTAGQFSITGELPTGRSPREAVIADFTGDGRPDAAVINRYSADVSILPSSATHQGLVSLDQIYPVSGDVSGLSVQDVNGDGRDDVLQLHRASNEMSIRKAGPDGTLGAPEFRSLGGQAPSGMATADVNNDGLPDVLSANLGWQSNSGSISVLLANADGTFAPPRTFNGGGSMFALAVADFDGDGNQDVAAGLFDCRVAFFRGDGAGNFTQSYFVMFVYESRVMVTGDFDQDGDMDIAGAGNAGDMVTLENRGAANTAGWVKQVYDAPGSSSYGTYRITLTRVNFDADPDLVIGTGNGAAVYLGGPGMNFEFTPSLSSSVSFSVSDVLLEDLDGDGVMDMVAACREASCINILTQTESGAFTLRAQADVPSGKLLATGDLDGDGKPDLVGTGDALWTVLSSRAAQTTTATTDETERTRLSEIVINEVLPQNTDIPLMSDNGKKPDFVEIFNGSATAANLTGWKVRLQSTQDGLPMDNTWTLPAVTAPAGGHAVIIFSDEPAANHTGFTLPAEGGTVTLLRPDNSEADRVDYPRSLENVSWSRYLDGHPAFHADRIPSPGMSNLDNGTVPPEVKLTPPSTATLIPGQPITFTARGRDDAGIISLSLLWNRIDAPMAEPGRIVLYDDGMHDDAGAVDGFFSGKLTPGLPAGAEVQFYLEAVDLSGDVLLLPDAAELTAPGLPPAAWSFSLTNPPPLEISEVCASNLTVLRDELGGYADFVKLRNAGAAPVNMAGILLAKSSLAESSAVYRFPPHLALQPGEEITVFADDNPEQGALHAPFTLDAGGDDLALLGVTPSGARQWIHSVIVPATAPDSIYRRLPDTDLHCVMAASSDAASWSGTAWDDNGAAFTAVRFTAAAGSTWRVDGDPAGAPVEWMTLQTIPGDGSVHTITRPLSEMDALRAVPAPALPGLRIDAVMISATGATVLGEAARAAEVTVFHGTTNEGTNALLWEVADGFSGSGRFEIDLSGLAPGWGYFYRVRSKNEFGEVWSANGTSFTTLPSGVPTPDEITLTRLQATEASVNIRISPPPPVNASVQLLLGTVDAFGIPAAWQRTVPATLTSVANTWTAHLPGLSRETEYFARAVIYLGGTPVVSAARLVFRTPDTRQNLLLNLRLSEIMYHPNDSLSLEEEAAGFEEDDFEFIELHNDSGESMDLSGLWFENGLDFAFPLTGGPVLAPGGFAVIAAHPHAFAMRYGAHIPLIGWTLHPFRRGRLANGGENITLRTADGTVVFDIPYNDQPYTTDGAGHSLDYRPSLSILDPESASEYDSSLFVGGTPGQAATPPPDLRYDAWKLLLFSPGQAAEDTVAGMTRDPDQDGLTNLEEFLFATEPMVPNSPALLSVLPLGDGRVQLTWPVNVRALGARLQLETCISPNSGWSPVQYMTYEAGIGAWITIFGQQLTVVPMLPSLTDQQLVRIILPSPTQSEPRRYFRLRVSAN
jgi:hypothetical protein